MDSPHVPEITLSSFSLRSADSSRPDSSEETWIFCRLCLSLSFSLCLQESGKPSWVPAWLKQTRQKIAASVRETAMPIFEKWVLLLPIFLLSSWSYLWLPILSKEKERERETGNGKQIIGFLRKWGWKKRAFFRGRLFREIALSENEREALKK